MAQATLTDDFVLEGSVDFDNLVEVRDAGDVRIAQTTQNQNGQGLTLSLRGLTEANSVTVALLIAWMRSANNRRISIVYVDVPQELRNIIDFSGLTQVLPLDHQNPQT
jgi:ABC-type transporter Mla MlaB component